MSANDEGVVGDCGPDHYFPGPGIAPVVVLLAVHKDLVAALAVGIMSDPERRDRPDPGGARRDTDDQRVFGGVVAGLADVDTRVVDTLQRGLAELLQIQLVVHPAQAARAPDVAERRPGVRDPARPFLLQAVGEVELAVVIRRAAVRPHPLLEPLSALEVPDLARVGQRARGGGGIDAVVRADYGGRPDDMQAVVVHAPEV